MTWLKRTQSHFLLVFKSCSNREEYNRPKGEPTIIPLSEHCLQILYSDASYIFIFIDRNQCSQSLAEKLLFCRKWWHTTGDVKGLRDSAVVNLKWDLCISSVLKDQRSFQKRRQREAVGDNWETVFSRHNKAMAHRNSCGYDYMHKTYTRPA